ncbi:MAG: hypothetical protein EP329_01105 [Deltaproteobacteria bacterium]|nr:MAG: hypothetical protein EP329_01105 [Deltaproteobacteria bacterium]
MSDAAESTLSGDVSASTSGGIIRYKIWPARRHPVRLVIAVILVVGATAATAVVFHAFFWALVVALGLTVAAAPFFFPTLVGLDGPTLNVRALGTPRVWNLARFQRIEVSSDVLPRVELLTRARLSPVDTLESVVVPLPEDKVMADQVVVHLRRWVGRRPTGRFAIDADHAPEDSLEPEA